MVSSSSMVAKFSPHPRPIDRTQVQQQLEALGYKPGEKIFLRAFYPQGDSRKDTDKGRKALAVNVDEVVRIAEQFQKEERGVYVVVNGGGHLDKEVSAARAIFYEHDDLDKEIQAELWQHLGLPEPTFQVDTGGKSIHSYWVFDAPIGIEDWRELQRDLLEYSDGDRAIKNPSRVMRLAGCWHPSGNQSRIIRNSGKRYNYLLLRRSVPRQKTEAQIFPPSQASTLVTRYEDITVPVPASVPLELCLAQGSRNLLNGVGSPGRNTAGAILARDLIGTANYLRSISQGMDGSPRVLFQDFASRCNPPLDARESEDIWRKAERANPSPSCKEEGVNNCITAWYWNNHVKKGVHQIKRAMVTHKRVPESLSVQHAAEQARSILRECDNEIAANIRLEVLRRSCGMSDYSWANNIIKPLKRELEGQRFKLELLGLLQMEDEVERERLIAQLAPKYSMSASRIEKAMGLMRSRTQTPETKILDLDELFDLEVEALNWLIPGLLPARETIVLSGAPKSGKTLMAVDLAFCIATAEADFLGETVRQGKVLLVSTDESPSSTQNKLQNRGFRRQDKDSIKIVPSWDISQMAVLEKILEDFKPDLTIIDSLRRINKGSEISENSAEFADNVYTLKETLSRYGSAGVLIHHTNKDREALGVDRLRGSSAIAGAVWGVWQMDCIPKPDPNNKKRMIVDPKDPRRVLSAFARDAEGQQLTVELNLENSSWRNLGSGESEEELSAKLTIRDRILKVLSSNPSPMSGKAIVEALDGGVEVAANSVYNELNAMEHKRLINSKPAPGDKRYKVFSLPRKSQQNSTNTLPPLPPTPSVQNMTNFSETQSVYGFEDSHIDSHVIVISPTGTIEPEIAEPHTETGIENSHIGTTVTRGGGVEELESPSSPTLLQQPTEELAQRVRPRVATVLLEEVTMPSNSDMQQNLSQVLEQVSPVTTPVTTSGKTDAKSNLRELYVPDGISQQPGGTTRVSPPSLDVNAQGGQAAQADSNSALHLAASPPTNPSQPTPAEQLADLVRAAIAYEQIEAAKAQYPGLASLAAKFLTQEELERIRALKPPELVLSDRLKKVNTLEDFKAVVLEFASSYRGTWPALNEAIEEAIARSSISRPANQLYSWWNQIWKEI